MLVKREKKVNRVMNHFKESKKMKMLKKVFIAALCIGAMWQTKAREFDNVHNGVRISYITTSSNTVAVKPLSAPGNYSGNLVIPDTVTDVWGDGNVYTVTSVEDRTFYWNPAIISVTLPNTLTTIGWETFAHCYSLTSVTLGNSVVSIGQGAFLESPSLSSIVIPNSTTTIGQDCFKGCTSLASVTLGDSITSIGDAAFMNSAVTSVIIPNMLTSIGQDVFRDCAALTAVTIGNSVTSIGLRAFENCPALNSLTFTPTSSVATIGNRAFTGGVALSSVTFPNSLSSIEEEAFMGCGLTNIVFGTSPLNIGKAAFKNCTSLPALVLPGTATPGEESFMGCTGLTSLTLNEGITTIGIDAFKACSALPAVTFPNSLTTIERAAFTVCTSLDTIVFGTSPLHIGLWAFLGCTGIKSLVIPGTATIAKEAFRDCNDLASLTLNDGITTIDTGAFTFCTSLPSVVIPNSVTKLGERAFANCINLTSVTLSNTLPRIETHTFLDCAFPSFTIPSSVTTIDGGAFEGSALTSIVIPNSVTSLGGYAFYNCASLATVTIPQSLGTIAESAFANCDAIRNVYNFRLAPQPINTNVFSTPAYNAATLHVYASSRNAYLAATGWLSFYNIASFASVTGVSLDKHAITVFTTQTDQLTAIITPSDAPVQEVTWTTSDATVATVSSSGLVTGISSGTATVRVRTVDGNFSDSCIVTVNQTTAISLDKHTISLSIGNTDQLTATVNPSQVVVWSSSDAGVAIVDNTGLVMAIADGTATITATTADGFFSDSCIVTVNSTTTLTLDQHTLSLNVGTSQQLTATVNPVQALVWNSSNSSVAGVSNTGLVMGIAQGVATIIVSTTDGYYHDSCIVTVGTLGLNDAQTSKVSIYPNPTRDNITISLPDNATNAMFILYDMQGRTLLQQSINSDKETISVLGLSAGFYTYSISTEAQWYNGRLNIIK